MSRERRSRIRHNRHQRSGTDLIRLIRQTICLATIVSICRCSTAAGPAKSEPGAPSPATAAAGRVEQTSRTGLFLGIIRLDGQAPVLKPLVNRGAAVRDPRACATRDPIPDERLVVDPNRGGIANVIIWMRRPPAGWQPPRPEKVSQPARIEMKNCRFFPHALAFRSDQKLRVVNSDPCVHNFQTQSFLNSPVNVLLPPKRDLVLDFQKSERVPFVVQTNLHPWMKAFLLPIEHPFFAVTDREGKFVMRDLPTGQHQFRVWHEAAGYLEKELIVEFKNNRGAKVSLMYPVEKFPLD